MLKFTSFTILLISFFFGFELAQGNMTWGEAGVLLTAMVFLFLLGVAICMFKSGE